MATGRNPGHFVESVRGLPINAPVVACNGNAIYDLYKDKLLDKFDYRTVSLDGTSTNGKYAEESCTFTMGTEASDITKVRTFLWNGMQEMLPLMESCDLDCSAE